MIEKNQKRDQKKLIERLKEETRRLGGFGHDQALAELNWIMPGWDQGKTHELSGQCLDLATVRCVAIIQSAVKACIRTIVDTKSSAGHDLPESTEKITLEMVREFKSNSFSIGDFYANLMHLSSYDQINGALLKSADISLERVLTMRIEKNEDVAATLDILKKYLRGLFARRNLLCHEACVIKADDDRSDVMQWAYLAHYLVYSLRHFTIQKVNELQIQPAAIAASLTIVNTPLPSSQTH